MPNCWLGQGSSILHPSTPLCRNGSAAATVKIVIASARFFYCTMLAGVCTLLVSRPLGSKANVETRVLLLVDECALVLVEPWFEQAASRYLQDGGRRGRRGCRKLGWCWQRTAPCLPRYEYAQQWCRTRHATSQRGGANTVAEPDLRCALHNPGKVWRRRTCWGALSLLCRDQHPLFLVRQRFTSKIPTPSWPCVVGTGPVATEWQKGVV